MLLKLIKNSTNGFDMALFKIFSINQNVIQIYNNKYIKLFGQDLIDVAMEAGQRIKEIKKHYLVLEMTVLGLENRFLFVIFLNPHLVIGVCQV